MKAQRLFLLAIIAGLLLPVTVHAGEGWGLHFTEKGAQPQGNKTSEYLMQYDAFYVGAPEEKVIYLTFDAGYENGYTAQILDTLKKHNAPAAFFLVGTYIRDEPELIKRMVSEGHIVANHTMRHPDMSAISSKDAFNKELSAVEELYRTATGQEMPRFYRPPKGIYNEANLKLAQELGYKTIFWSLAYRDWENDKQPSRAVALEKMLPRIHSGAVILLHNTSKTNADVLDELLTEYKNLGYRFEDLFHLVGGDEFGSALGTGF
ncbi:MAG: polysaccharide deacetylase family protein [Defluviitaleaceae bacterium]|nr:polysaccharide deacetylase family protein [Defluviitaleaceae bacterium]MCL2274766.1 polysaccharide deacetylase family protein [Defluviitaleaceae bacterium]